MRVRTYHLNTHSFILGAAIALAVITVVGLVFSQGGSQSNQNQQNAGSAQTSTKQQPRNGAAPTLPGDEKGSVTDQHTERQKQEASEDLKAQWEQAYWGKVAAIATALGVGVAGFAALIAVAGVIFVARTLGANRAMVTVASDTAQRQLRAYVLSHQCE